jgi:hypothetical protein
MTRQNAKTKEITPGKIEPQVIHPRNTQPRRKTMSDFDAREFFHSLNDEEGAAGVDNAFAALSKTLSPTDFKAAVDAIEDDFIKELREEIRTQGATAVKGTTAEHLKEAGLPAAQATAQLFLHIARVKGDQASPLVRAFVAAAEKLTDDEYNSVECAKKPMMAAIDAAAEEPVVRKPNPFRQKPTPN